MNFCTQVLRFTATLHVIRTLTRQMSRGPQTGRVLHFVASPKKEACQSQVIAVLQSMTVVVSSCLIFTSPGTCFKPNWTKDPLYFDQKRDLGIFLCQVCVLLQQIPPTSKSSSVVRGDHSICKTEELQSKSWVSWDRSDLAKDTHTHTHTDDSRTNSSVLSVHSKSMKPRWSETPKRQRFSLLG